MLFQYSAAYHLIVKVGIDADVSRSENERELVFTVRIPKVK